MASDFRLLKSQRNVILGLVRASGLRPGDFQWDEMILEGDEDRLRVSVLRHTPTSSYFRFGCNWDEYAPGFSRRTDSRIVLESWDDRFRLVFDWLTYVKREYEAPDLWQMLLQETKLSRVASSPDLTNDAFTQDEKQYIVKQLAEIKTRLISDHRIQLQQAEVIEQGFSHLADSLNRVGKKDWLLLAMGAVVSIAIGAGLPPDVAQDMMHRLMQAIEPLFQSILKVLG
jgi:hypothetical protein